MPEIFKNRAFQVVLGVVAVLAIAVIGVVLALGPGNESSTVAQPAQTQETMEAVDPSPSTPAPTSEPTSSATATPSTAGCTTYTGDMESPTKFTVERMGVDSRMMVVGKDSAGNPGAPPPNQAYTTAWYNGSPAPGSTQGNVILTIHTYSKGQALGNDLYGKNGLQEGSGGLKEGDLIKISDANGNQVCYRYTGNTKVWVKTYDPASGVFHNPDGPPQLAIMICWDYAPSRNDWDSRIIFYADLIPEGQPT